MPTNAQKKLIEDLVRHYRDHIAEFKTFASVLRTQVMASPELRKHIRFIRVRIKEPDHLRDKLYRKLKDATDKRKKFNFSKKNLFVILFVIILTSRNLSQYK